MSQSAEMTLLSAAARALKILGESAPMSKQIDSVSNALIGTRRVRELSAATGGLPVEVRSVLENIRNQIQKVSPVIEEVGETPEDFKKFVEDLEVIEKFAELLVFFYKPKDQALPEDDALLTRDVQRSLALVKSEFVSTGALRKLQKRLFDLEATYRNNPEMSQEDFHSQLAQLAGSIRMWEEELLPGDPLLHDSTALRSAIAKIKSDLHEAYDLSEMEEHPGVMGEASLNLLRLSSEITQSSKSQFEIIKAIDMAMRANANLERSGERFQEAGRVFNLIIQQSVALFVDKQIEMLEQEMKIPVYFVPGNLQKNQRYAERLLNHKERLVSYYRIVKEWSGPHKEDLAERIALLYESLTNRAERAKDFLLDETVKQGKSVEEAGKTVRIAAVFRLAASLGRNEVKPYEIFKQSRDISFRLQELLDQLPDPTFHKLAPIAAETLGRYYDATLGLAAQTASRPELLQTAYTVMERIDARFTGLKDVFSIDNEIAVMPQYFGLLQEQEGQEFLMRLGVSPELTLPERYSDYPEPGLYPFKGDELLQLVKFRALLHNFLEGAYGKVDVYPDFEDVLAHFKADVQAHRQRVLMTFYRRAGLSLSRPHREDKIREIIHTKKVTANQKSAANNELVAIGEYLSEERDLKNACGSSILETCQRHLEIAEKILRKVAEIQPQEVHALHVKLLPDLFADAERLSFSQNPAVIDAANGERQFHKDHQIPEVLPLYVQGISVPREESVDLGARLLAAARGDSRLAKSVETYATRFLFQVPLDSQSNIREAICGMPGLSRLLMEVEDASQFLTFHEDKKSMDLVGFARIAITVANPETESTEEVGSIVMKTEMRITSEKPSDVRISFLNQSYGTAISLYREGSQWGLL